MNRNQFLQILVDKNLNGKGVEIGVHKGFYSRKILASTKLEVLYSIDPYPRGHEDFLLKAASNLRPFRERSVIVIGRSWEVAHMFPDRSLDFVYIDAEHDYNNVKRDIEAYWPKVREGGMFAGHDYSMRTMSRYVSDSDTELGLNMRPGEQTERYRFGVIEAVNEHCLKYDLALYLTNEEIDKSWYCFRGKLSAEGGQDKLYPKLL